MLKVTIEAKRILVEPGWRYMAAFEQEFSVDEPKAYMLRAKGLKKPDWNGRNEFFTRSESTEGRYYLKMGFLQRLKKFCGQDEFDGEERCRLNVPYHHEVRQITLDPMQERVSKLLLSWRFAAIELETSSGKTEIAANSVACWIRQHPARPVLILVPSKNLLNQTAERIQLRVPWLRVGKFGDGQKPKATDNVVVMTIGSARLKRTDLSGYSVLVIDEAHHSDCASVVGVINRQGHEWEAIWALSGKLSYINEPMNQMSIEGVLGQPLFSGGVRERQCKVAVILHRKPKWAGQRQQYPSGVFDQMPCNYLTPDGWREAIYRGLSKDGVPAFTVLERGNLVPDKEAYGLYEADGETRIDPQPDREYIVYQNASDMGLVEFKERNEWAIKLAARFADAKEPFMVTVARYRHATKLVRRARKAGLVVEVVSGRQSGEEQTERFKRLAEGDLQGLICVYQTASEGVDCGPLMHLIKLDGIGSEQICEQQLGRLRRKHPGKTIGLLHLPDDQQHTALQRIAAKVVDYYRARTVEIVEV